MRASFKFYLLFPLVFTLIQQSSVAQQLPPNVKRIVFLGNSITWAGYYVNDIEVYLRVQYPGRELEFINVGLPSETVSGLSEPGHANGEFPRPDLHERLARILDQTHPDLVFACYGMNDGIYQPFDESRFEKYKEGVIWLHNQVVKTGARIIHITPPDYDEVKGKNTGYAHVLDRYADWLLGKKSSSGWKVIDIHYPMKKYLNAHRKVDSVFSLDGFFLAQDGVHPNELGHWLIAREILMYLGYKDVAKKRGIVNSLEQIQEAGQLVKLVTERQNMMRDAWLTATGHKRPGLPTGLPLKGAQIKSGALVQEINAMIVK